MVTAPRYKSCVSGVSSRLRALRGHTDSAGPQRRFGGEAHRQLKSQLKLLVLKKLLDLAGYRHGNQAPNKVVAGNVHNIWPVGDKLHQ